MLEVGDRARMLGVDYDCVVEVLEVVCSRPSCTGCVDEFIAFKDPYNLRTEWLMPAREFERVGAADVQRAA